MAHLGGLQPLDASSFRHCVALPGLATAGAKNGLPNNNKYLCRVLGNHASPSGGWLPARIHGSTKNTSQHPNKNGTPKQVVSARGINVLGRVLPSRQPFKEVGRLLRDTRP